MDEQDDAPDEISRTLNIDRPSIARIYDYTLGGAANFEVDRQAAEELMRVFPGQRAYAYANRAFLRRAVTELVAAGFDQFLDLGSGIPTVGNVHEIAHRTDPSARVAYVDIDPVAVHHARELLERAETPSTVTASDVDVRDPAAVLAAPGVAGLLDFGRPVVVLLLGLLDIIDTPPERAVQIVEVFRDACVPGSALVISNGARLAITDEQARGGEAVFARTSTPNITFRDADEVAALFAGYDLLEPGVVPTAAWRPERPVSDTEAAGSNALAAVGIKAGTSPSVPGETGWS